MRTKPLKFSPLRDVVIVAPDGPQDMTTGGIVLPESAQKPPAQGTVLAVGPGKTLSDGVLLTPAVQVGDRVLYGQYGGHEITIDNRTVFVLREEQILGIL